MVVCLFGVEWLLLFTLCFVLVGCFWGLVLILFWFGLAVGISGCKKGVVSVYLIRYII